MVDGDGDASCPVVVPPGSGGGPGAGFVGLEVGPAEGDIVVGLGAEVDGVAGVDGGAGLCGGDDGGWCGVCGVCGGCDEGGGEEGGEDEECGCGGVCVHVFLLRFGLGIYGLFEKVRTGCGCVLFFEKGYG